METKLWETELREVINLRDIKDLEDAELVSILKYNFQGSKVYIEEKKEIISYEEYCNR